MAEPEDDVLGKLDALLRRHQPAEADIPVLTEIVVPPAIDLDGIPLLTDEVAPDALAGREAAAGVEVMEPFPLPELLPGEPPSPDEPAGTTDIAATTGAPEQEALPALSLPQPEQAMGRRTLEFELPPNACYVALYPELEAQAAPAIDAEDTATFEPVAVEAFLSEPATPEPPTIEPDGLGDPMIEPARPESGEEPANLAAAGQTAAPPAAAAPETGAFSPPVLSEEAIQLIADAIKADVAKILDAQLTHALAQQLQTSLHVALDRALASMLDQFVIHIEEVVKVAIASELEKRLGESRGPGS